MATTREIKGAAEEAGNHAAEAAQSVGNTIKNGIDKTTGELHHLRDRLSANGAHLEDELRDAGKRFSEGAKKFSEAAGEQVREHPLAAFGIAFAAGLIVSRWLRSR
ncbi:MAG: hypothetical protein ABI451_00480 [Dokdonella sp.]